MAGPSANVVFFWKIPWKWIAELSLTRLFVTVSLMVSPILTDSAGHGQTPLMPMKGRVYPSGAAFTHPMLQVKLLVLGAGGVTYGRAEEDVELAALDDDIVEVVKEVGAADELVDTLELVEVGAAVDDEREEAAAGLYM